MVVKISEDELRQALSQCNLILDCQWNEYGKEYERRWRVIKSALEKQIPVEFSEQEIDSLIMADCPICDCRVCADWNYCYNCGQAKRDSAETFQRLKSET